MRNFHKSKGKASISLIRAENVFRVEKVSEYNSHLYHHTLLKDALLLFGGSVHTTHSMMYTSHSYQDTLAEACGSGLVGTLPN